MSPFPVVFHHYPTTSKTMTTTTTTQPKACVWWSPTRAAWGCQIGNERSWHYNEADAIKEGERLGAEVARCSMFQVGE